ETLGIAREASEADIKKAYRKLAREFHPDRNPGDKNAAARFKEVQEAYEVLSNPEKKAKYDRFGFVGDGPMPGGDGSTAAGGGGAGGFQWGNFDPSAFEGGDLGDILSRFGFGGAASAGGGARASSAGRGRRSSRARPEAAEAEGTVPFLTAALGGNVSPTIDDQPHDGKITPGVEEGEK